MASDNVAPELLEAATKYGDRIVRGINTRVDISSIRSVQGKLRRLSRLCEEENPNPKDLLHDIWKAMGWLEDSFNSSVKILLREDYFPEDDEG